MLEPMKRIFKWLLLLVVILAAGITVVVYNPNLSRGMLEHRLSTLTGYGVHLQGDLGISPGRITVLSANDIRIAAPEWSSVNDLVVIGALVLKVDSASLFKPAVVVKDLLIDGFEVNLETGANGEQNWLPGPRSATADEVEDEAVVVQHARVAASTVRYLNRERDLRHVLEIASLEQRLLADGMLDITLEGSINDRPVRFGGAAGPYANLLRGRDVNFEGSGNFGSIEIRSKGFFDDLKNPRKPRFDLLMQGPDIDAVTAMLGAEDLGSGVFTVNAVGGLSDAGYKADVNAQIGDTSLRLAVTADDLVSFAEFDIDIAANGPNLGAFTRTLGLVHWPDQSFSIEGRAQRRGQTLNVPVMALHIGGSHLSLDGSMNNFPALDHSRVNLQVTGDDIQQFRELLGLRGFASGPFQLDGSLDVSPEGVELIQLGVTTAFGRMTLAGTLGESPGYLNSRLHLQLEGKDANQLMKTFGIDALPARPFSLDTHLLKTEKGFVFDRGVLVTIDNESLALDGLVSLEAGGRGTDIELTINGGHLGEALGRVAGGLSFADLPYRANGRIRVADDGVRFDVFEASFADVSVTAEGYIGLLGDSADDRLEFQWRGENFSSVGDFAGLDLPLDNFVPGQAYQLNGVLSSTDRGWRISLADSRIGETSIEASGLISRRVGYDGSYVEFSIEGPDLHGLLLDRDLSDLPLGEFRTSGRARLGEDRFAVDDFLFESTGIRGRLDLEVDLPAGVDMNARFDIDLRGDDIRHLIPANGWFEPDQAPYRITASGKKQGPLLSFRHFDLGVATLEASLEGSIGNASSRKGSKIRFAAASDDLSALGRVNGTALPAVPLSLQAEVSGNARVFSIRDIEGRLGESDMAAVIEVDLETARPSLAIDTQSRLIDLQPFYPEEEEVDIQPSEKAKSGDRVIPDLTLPLDTLELADVTLDMTADELRLPTNTGFDIVLQAMTDSGNLRVPRLSWTGVKGGKSNSTLFVEPVSGGPARVRFDLDAVDSVFTYTGLTLGQKHTTPIMDVGIHAEGYGNDLRTLAGSLSGEMFVFSAGGLLPDVQLSLLDTFIIDEVFKLVLAKRGDAGKDLDLQCAAAAFEISDGALKTNPAITFMTDRINLVAKGSLDLKKETLKYNFTATPRNALKLSATELFNPYILVSGTLAQPKVGLDPGRALMHGGAAVGTAGVSTLAKALLDRVGTTMPLCRKMLAQHQGD